jgi:hypothetical protein
MKKLLILLFILLSIFTGEAQDFQESGACQRDDNVNCSKWPSDLNDLKRSVFIISNGSQCTGTLINQRVSQDRLQQYFITAKHCITDKDYSTPWSFYFNYQSADCNDLSVPDGNNINNSNRNAQRYHHESLVTLIDKNSLNDMALLRIETPIPPHFNVYYAGWSISYLQGFQRPNYMVHHPRGDIKKIAQTNSAHTVTDHACHVVTYSVDVVFKFLFGWVVKKELRSQTLCTYVEPPYYLVPAWNEGVPESGSSGAAFVNNDGKIIGTESGGLSSCSSPVEGHVGRLNTAYNQSSALRNALNPDRDNVTSTEGRQVYKYNRLENLSGNYFPAKDYQTENQITLRASGLISTLVSTDSEPITLHIRRDANFIFQSDEQIVLRPGFLASTGAEFAAKISNTSGSREKTEEYENRNLLAEIRQIQIPETKKFDASRYSKNFTRAVESNAYLSFTPNPVTDNLQVNVVYAVSQPEVSITVFNQYGSQVYATTLHNVLSERIGINMEKFPEGLYVVKISSENKTFAERVIKK